MRFQLPSKANLLFQSFFWMAYFFFALGVIMGMSEGKTRVALPIAIFNTLAHIGMVNFHLYFLMPNFWRQGKRVLHVLLVLALILLTSAFKWACLVAVGLDNEAPDFAYNSTALISIVSSIFVFAVSTPFIFFDFLIEKERLQAELKTQTYQSEIRFLRAQMNPHFLFNVLNNLYSMIFTGSKEAGPTVLKLSELMRYMLYETDGKDVPLLKEVTYLVKLIALQTLKQGKHPTVEFEVGEIPQNTLIPPLLLVSFFENAFKHSSWDAEDGSGFIKGHLRMEDDVLHLELRNSIGQTAPADTPGGIGLSNTRQRLNLLYPNKHTLETKASGKIYEVDLRIQLTPNPTLK